MTCLANDLFAIVLGRFAKVLSRFANALLVNSPTSDIQTMANETLAK